MEEGDAHDFSMGSQFHVPKRSQQQRGHCKLDREEGRSEYADSLIKQDVIHNGMNQAIMIAYRQIKTRDNIYLV